MREMLAALLVLVLMVHAETEKRHELIYNGLAESDFFFHNLSKRFTDTSYSMVISPYSLHSALTQTAVFAGGPSADEMLQTLGLFYIPWYKISSIYDSPNNMLRNELYNNGIHTFDVILMVACGTKLIQLRTINRPYIEETPIPVNLNIPCINPEAIRSFIESKADDNIAIEVPPRLLIPGSLLLLNTMMVQAEWQRKFYKGNTRRQKFRSLDPRKYSSITVNMLTTVHNFNWKRDTEFYVDVVEIPLKGGELGFFIVLPHENHQIFDVENTLLARGRTPGSLADGLTETVVNLVIPKFRIRTELKLKKILQDMGISRVFSEQMADFSQISYVDKYYLSDVIHATAIEINEEGISLSDAAEPLKLEESKELTNPTQSFVADRPFSFFIRHNYLGRVLISGRYTGK